MAKFSETQGDSLYGNAQDGWAIYDIGPSGGTQTQPDWDAVTKYGVALDVGTLETTKWGTSLKLDTTGATATPVEFATLTRSVTYRLTKSGLVSPQRTKSVIVAGLDSGTVVDTTPPTVSSVAPANDATGVAQATQVVLTFSEAVAIGAGSFTFTNVTDSTTLGALDVTISSDVVVAGSTVTLTPTFTLPYAKVIRVTAPSGTITDLAGNDWAGWASGAYDFTVESAPVVADPVPLPEPAYSAWDFDHTAATWDTSTDVTTFAGIISAWNTALADKGTTAVPRYHRIRYTGGTLTGAQTGSITSTDVTDTNVFVLIEGAAGYSIVNGEVLINGSPKNSKWVNWQFQPINSTEGSTGIGGGAFRATCFRQNNANGTIAFENCRFGLFWRGTYDPSEYPWGFTTTGSVVKATIRNCDFRNMFECLSVRSGRFHAVGNFVTGLLDDFAFLTVRNAGDGFCYLYSARNVGCDYADDPAYSGNHPDWIQTGAGVDATTDRYQVQCFQDVVLGDTNQQYPVHGAFLQPGGASPATTIMGEVADCVFLVSGSRGIGFSDRRSSARRVLIAHAPTGAASPTTGTGWTGGIRKPGIQTEAAYGSGNTPVFENIFAEAFVNGDGWTQTEAEVIDHKIDRTTQTGEQAYANRFPALAAAGMLSWNGTQTVIAAPNSAVMPRTRQGVRDYVSQYWEPASTANGTGWAANGLNDPADFGGA